MSDEKHEKLTEEVEQPQMNVEGETLTGEDYAEKSEVNGVEISVAWDGGYHDYTIYFPQLELGDEAYEKGVSDQVIRISEDPNIARKVYNFACEAAKYDGDIHSLYKKVENFAREHY